jgi:hypothetical protein
MIRIVTRLNIILLLLSLFSAFRLNAQLLTSADLAKLLDESTEVSPWEEVYLHIDRDKYIAGEDIWFSIYSIDRETGKLSARSAVAYVELLNPWNMPVIQKRLQLSGGRGEGNFLLPDSISSGTYTIRAYTNWMKNFLPDNCFMYDIDVYNPFKGSDFWRKVDSAKSFDARFFHESGKTLDGLVNKVAVNYSLTGDVEITITADGSFALPSTETYLLVIQTCGRIDYRNNLKIKDIVTKIKVPRTWLSGGVNQIALIREDGKVMFERMIYSPQKNESTINVNPDSIYGRREKVSLKIGISNNNAVQEEIHEMSISVAPADGSAACQGINDYIIFGTEFGKIPWTNGNKSIPDLNRDLADSFLLCSESRWIRWQDIISRRTVPKQYRFESDGHFLSVKIRYREDNVPDSSDFLYMSIQGKVAEFNYAGRDTAGRFTFILPPDNKLRNLIIQPEHPDNNMILEIEPSFSWILPSTNSFKDTFTDSQLDVFSGLSFNYQAAKIYGTRLKKEAEIDDNGKLQKRRFYGIPEMEIFLDDYIKLPSMQEVFFELLPGVNLRSRKSRYEIKIANPLTGVFYEEPPLVMIDGVIINDLTVLVDLNPETVEKIEVVKTPYLIGDLILHGIVNVITRSGNFSNITMPDYALILPYRVIDKPSTFTAPDYSDDQNRLSRKPDLRNTLYWNPSVKTNRNGEVEIEFWTSDLPGIYTINLQGISGTGEKVSLHKSFRVR